MLLGFIVFIISLFYVPRPFADGREPPAVPVVFYNPMKNKFECSIYLALRHYIYAMDTLTSIYGPCFSIGYGPFRMTLMTESSYAKEYYNIPETDLSLESAIRKILSIMLLGEDFEKFSWSDQKKLVMNILGNINIMKFKEIVKESCKRSIDEMQGEKYIIFDFSSRILSRMMIGVAYGLDSKFHSKEYQHVIYEAQSEATKPIALLTSRIPFFGPAKKALRLKGEMYDTSLEVLQKYIDRFNDARKNPETKKGLSVQPDSYISEAIENNFLKDVDHHSFIRHITNMVSATQTSTSQIFGWTIICIMKYKEVYKKLVDMIENEGDDPELIKETDKFIDACIHESTRWWGNLYSFRYAKKDTVITPRGKEYLIKKNTIMAYTPSYSINYSNSKNVPWNPIGLYELNGDLNAFAKKYLGSDSHMYFPFGSGKHMCSGKHVAKLEISQALRYILKNCDVNVNYPDMYLNPETASVYDWATSIANPLTLKDILITVNYKK